MHGWFASEDVPGQYRKRTRKGYVSVTQEGEMWRIGRTGHLVRYRSQAQAHAEMSGPESEEQIAICDLMGRDTPVLFQREMIYGQSWVAVVGRMQGVAFQARIVADEDVAGEPPRWRPHVPGIDMAGYADMETAMRFAAEAAFQRMDAARAEQRREGFSFTSDDALRYESYGEAIRSREEARPPEARGGNWSHPISEGDIQAAGLLRELGFTLAQVGHSLRLSPEIVHDICRLPVAEATARWLGRSSYTTVPEDRPAVSLLHAEVASEDGSQRMQVQLRRISAGGADTWQAEMAGRVVGQPQASIEEALTRIIPQARQAMAAGMPGTDKEPREQAERQAEHEAGWVTQAPAATGRAADKTPVIRNAASRRRVAKAEPRASVAAQAEEQASPKDNSPSPAPARVRAPQGRAKMETLTALRRHQAQLRQRGSIDAILGMPTAKGTGPRLGRARLRTRGRQDGGMKLD